MSGSGTDDDESRRRAAAAGGVQHDARGNAVWKWAVDTGRHALDSTSRLLKRLEVPGLSIEGEAQARDTAPEGEGRAGGPAASGTGATAHKSTGKPPVAARAAGYDPYGGAGGAHRASPASQAGLRPAASNRPAAPARKPAAAAAPRRSLWQRLFRRG